jgi:magnesium-transporting ATPase (P-type)
VETLGSVTVICSDKTGTLTRNEMTVQRVVTADRIFEVSGVGYAPIGGFSVGGEPIMPEEAVDLPAIARAVRLCNDANLRERDGEWRMDGDPTEGALLTLALKSGLDPVAEQARFRRLDSIPFESEHRFMATLHHDHHGEHVIHVKGAPERVLAMCADERHPDGPCPLRPAYWHEQLEALAAQGQRVLAVAYRPVPKTQHELTFADVEAGLTCWACSASAIRRARRRSERYDSLNRPASGSR